MNEQQTLEKNAVSRRRFLGYAGALVGAGVATSMIGCKPDPDPMEGTIDLGSGDNGALNLIYAIKQIQTVMYQRVVVKPYEAMPITNPEYMMLRDIRDHKLAQRELLRKLLSNNAIKDLEMDFTGIDFTKRTSVLSNLRNMEEFSITAMNGVAAGISNDAYLEVIGKIASVEARHATAIRNTFQFGDFTDDATVDKARGLDGIRNPAGVVPLLHSYLKDRLNPTNIPTS